ncbi:MAG: ATP phosphoribosyltransferase regulatory subunit [Clostridia bacterium]
MEAIKQPVRGTQDFLPTETRIREYVRKKILDSYAEYGFLQIKTPILENIELLNGSDGGDNLRLMFKILKRGEKLDLTSIKSEDDLVDMGLRYDLTVPLARFYSNNCEKLPMPFKSIQIDDAFRAERPQRGRLRQFVQCDIDILGDASNNAEIECLMVSANAMMNIGFTNFEYKVSDRRILTDLILKAGFPVENISSVCITLDKLDKIGIDGIKNELIQKNFVGNVDILISSIQKVQENGIDALRELDVNKEAVSNVSKIVNAVNLLSKGKNFSASFDISIIRGQGYYTSSVFEIYANGFSGACGGGGRYDTMIEKISGKKSPAVGFSLGFERLCLILNEQNFVPPQKEMIALIFDNGAEFTSVFAYAQELSKNYVVNSAPKAKNFNNQLLKLKENGFTKWVYFEEKIVKEIK